MVEPPRSDLEILQIARAGIGGAAEDEDALVLVTQERLERVAPQVRVHGHGVRPVALEGLSSVALGGVADVAPLAVEDHRDVGAGAVHILDGALELILGP